MRAWTSKYALALLIGFLVLASAFVIPTWAFQNSGNASTSTSEPSENDGGYTWVMAGQGFLEGTRSSLEGYKAPDGERINTTTAQFGSAEAAKAAHQHLDHSAAEVLKKEDIVDGAGKVIGERSVLILINKDKKKSTAIVITKGADFREYVSSSARDALAFEDYAEAQLAK
jgi:hypothetical protein